MEMSVPRERGFRVIGDDTVHDILINLSKGQIIWFCDELTRSLVQFSTGGERQYQPHPGVIARPIGQKILFRTFTSPSQVGVKIIVDRNACTPGTESTSESSVTSRKKETPLLRGILAICDDHGVPTGVINAEQVTAYRTALCALLPFRWRRKVEDVVVFGAGKQAQWHIRLALALRGSEINRITIVNRSHDRANSLRAELEEENRSRWKSHVMFDCLSPSSDAYEERLERLLGAADAVLCMVPSQEPLFPARYLIGDAKDKKRSVYVSAIGSWQPEMIELDPALLRYAVDGGGLIIVDDCEHVLEVGEIIQSGVGRNQMVELGELFDVRQLRRDAERLHRPESDVNAWLEDGMVIYKSAGVGLMDLAAGTAILALASERGLGVVVSDF